MKNFKTENQIREIIGTELYKSGEAFTIAQMTKACTMVRFNSRMSEILRRLMDEGFIQSHNSGDVLMYKKSGEKWLRKRWVSEVAEALCSGDCFGNLTPKEGGNVGSSAREVQVSGAGPRSNSL